jgi:hypothetical protein
LFISKAERPHLMFEFAGGMRVRILICVVRATWLGEA